jgi:hypothetical protein
MTIQSAARTLEGASSRGGARYDRRVRYGQLLKAAGW